MTTKDKALRMALEALESSVATCFDRYAYDQFMSRPEHFVNQAITAIREALSEQPAHESAYQRGYMDGIAKGLRMEQPAQQHQEPVAVYVGETWCGSVVRLYEDLPLETPLYTSQQPAQQQEPVVRWDSDGWGDLLVGSLPDGTLLYTSPPPRKPWAGLSTDEIYGMYNEPRSDAEMVEFARAIEAKLREKNA